MRTSFKLMTALILLCSCATKPPAPGEPVPDQKGLHSVTKTVYLPKDVIHLRRVTHNKGVACVQYFLDGSFDGQKFNTKFDTGSDSTIVPEAEMFKHYPATRSIFLAGSAGISTKANLIHLHEVKIGNTLLPVKDAIRFSTDGISFATLGVTAFSDQSMVIDMPHDTLFLGLPQNGNFPDLIISKHGKILIHAKSPSTESFNAMIDTGACLTTVDQEYIKNHPEEFTPELNSAGKPMFAQAQDITGKRIKRKMFRMNTFFSRVQAHSHVDY